MSARLLKALNVVRENFTKAHEFAERQTKLDPIHVPATVATYKREKAELEVDLVKLNEIIVRLERENS